MKRTVVLLLATAISPLSAHAVPIPYEFSATVDGISYAATAEPIPPDIQAAFAALVGKAMVGTFRYESDVGPPVISSPLGGSAYNGLMTDLVATIAGFDVVSAFGSGAVSSAGTDRLTLSGFSLPVPGSPPPPSLGEILGYEVRGFSFAWLEGVPPNDNPIPPFLADNNPPVALPPYHSQLFVALVLPGITPINPRAPATASLFTLNATVRPVTVPEPGSLALLALGAAGAVVARRRAAR